MLPGHLKKKQTSSQDKSQYDLRFYALSYFRISVFAHEKVANFIRNLRTTRRALCLDRAVQASWHVYGASASSAWGPNRSTAFHPRISGGWRRLASRLRSDGNLRRHRANSINSAVTVSISTLRLRLCQSHARPAPGLLPRRNNPPCDARCQHMDGISRESLANVTTDCSICGFYD